MGANPQPTPAISAQAVIPAESIWFQGHFPGDPLLPGVAQLHLVMEAIREALGGEVRLTGLKRVRFKRIIRPGEPIAITAAPDRDTPGLYRFQVMVAGENACSGMMMATAASTIDTRPAACPSAAV